MTRRSSSKPMVLVSLLLVAPTLASCGVADSGDAPPDVTPAKRAVSASQPIMAKTTNGAPAAPASGTAHLDYNGGRVLASVGVVAVFWGSNVDGTTTSSIPGFFSAVTQSSYMDWLSEYDTTLAGGTNQVIGRGSYNGSVTITPNNTNTSITDDDIRTELGQQLDSGVLPAPGSDTIYMVYFPPGMVITAGGETSCAFPGFCAYHQSFSHGGSNVTYGVVPDFGPGSGCDFGCGASTQFGNTTSASSHELIEAVTDADFQQGWWSAADDEIGDICNQQQATLPGTSYIVQQEWSNRFNACVIGFGSGAVVGMGGKCLDLPGFDTDNGTPIQYFDCNDGPNQSWSLSATTELRGFGNKCIDLPGFDTDNGTQLQYFDCNGGGNQEWPLTNVEIRGLGNKCLDLPSSSTDNGTIVQDFTCNGGSNQRWTFTAAGEIRGLGNKCLDVPGFNTANGTLVQLFDCNGGDNQKWTILPGGAIQGLGGKCLDLPGFNTADQTPLQIFDCNGGVNQQWFVDGQIQGFGGKCVDLPGFDTDNGTLLQYFDCNGGPNQNWFFFP